MNEFMEGDGNTAFWKWAIVSAGYAACAFLGFFGMLLLFPGAVLLIAAIAVATKLEDFDDS
jgi:quinol-cytochrome oxidoreductase complex cytochrome b subunit